MGRHHNPYLLTSQQLQTVNRSPASLHSSVSIIRYKMDIDRATVGLGLKVLSTVTAGIFAGGALYINVVEHPARMEAPDMATAVTSWKPSFTRAARILSKVAMTSSATSISAYVATRDTGKEHAGWLVTGCLFMGIPILTKLIIIPLNNQLLDTDNCIKEKGDEWIEENLNLWNRRHSYRTLLGLGALAGMVVLLATEKN